MMERFEAILLFYKPYFIWSFGINILLSSLNYDLFPLIVIKLLLVLFLWYAISETASKQRLVFYNNLGISSLKLFSSVFLIDTFITIAFYVLIKEFI